MIATYEDFHARGLTLTADAAGRLHVRRHGHRLNAADLHDLQQYRARIAAGWLWELTELPPILAWDPTIAEALMAKAVDWVRGPAFPPDANWSLVEAADAALEEAWRAQDLTQWVPAVKTWTSAVLGLWAGSAAAGLV
jgi:hypothetical protein